MASQTDPSLYRTDGQRRAPGARVKDLSGIGMADRIRQHDWTACPLGPQAVWPPHLQATVDLMAAHGFPMIVLWGTDLLQIYNDGYAEIMAEKHPAGLGQPTAECWPEVWHINGPIYDRVWQGETLVFSDKCYPLHRRGALQDVWFTITYSPLRDGHGDIEGVLVTMFDTTAEHVARVERERSEAELRLSNERLRLNEERFRQFAAASSDVLWIRDADTLAAELQSTAFDAVYGIAADEAACELREWAARVVPDDRDAAIGTLRDVRDGTRRVHEFRVLRPSDGQFRWIRDTVFPLFDAQGRVTRIAGISSDVTDERRWTEHQSVLVAELQHRVRNIMATIGSITLRTRESATSVEDYAQRLSGRVMSLARTQALLTRAANVGIDLRTLLTDELGSHAATESRVVLRGPSTVVPPKAAEVLSLAIHELASNAVRHGALREPSGRVDVTWSLREGGPERWLDVRWRETHAPRDDWQQPCRRGFGMALVEERIPYELDGEGHLRMSPDGTEAQISFPLRQRDSILQTDAPSSAGVGGGSVDLGDAALLAGCRVLVVEDDFYLAHDTAAALRSAGAEVDGPHSAAATALHALSTGRVDAAVVDLNLGRGAEASLVKALQAAGLPYVVVTGYDDTVESGMQAACVRLQKPAAAASTARALAGLVRQRRH